MKPRYELKGSGLRVHFAALKSALFESDNTEFSDNYDGAKKTTLNLFLLTSTNPGICYQQGNCISHLPKIRRQQDGLIEI